MERILIDGLSFAIPLFVMAIGGIYSEKSGVTNLALEGLQGMGAFIGAFVAVLAAGYFGSNSQVPYYLAIVCAMAGGMLYSLLYGLLCIRLKANQIIGGVVINILAMSLTAFFTKLLNRLVFGAASEKFVLGVSARFTIPLLSGIPVIGAAFKDVYPFEILILLIAVVAWYVLYKTRYGMNLRACGDNPHAVDAAGENVTWIRLIAVLVSGALSGLAGISFAYSISANFSSNIYVGYGYLAIAAMIFGNWKILPTLGSCLLFGFARSGGYYLVQKMQMPSSYSDLAMTLPYIVTMLLLIFFSKYNRAPRALGEIYDKGKR
ncbi:MULTISPECIES: ABC transporter permease [Clostridium]|jgi:general nucleoside transport system permease protein|uniref:ABC transporter permease n=1 Tax=Clostridium TaxID=1485 RepID=UPI000E4F0839|nr:ABC transporter permease [Clostridium fessum]RHP59119.1 ABC transporter permease [Clostridium sp. AF29-8BH]